MEDRIVALENHVIAVEKHINAILKSFGKEPLDLLTPGKSFPSTKLPETSSQQQPRGNLRGIFVVKRNAPQELFDNVKDIIKSITKEPIIDDAAGARVLIILEFTPGGRTDIRPGVIRSIQSPNQTVYLIVCAPGTIPVFAPPETKAVVKQMYGWLLDSKFTNVPLNKGDNAESINALGQELNNVFSTIQCSVIGCESSAAFKCGNCNTTMYCSNLCARQDWATGHGKECRK